MYGKSIMILVILVGYRPLHVSSEQLMLLYSEETVTAIGQAEISCPMLSNINLFEMIASARVLFCLPLSESQG